MPHKAHIKRRLYTIHILPLTVVNLQTIFLGYLMFTYLYAYIITLEYNNIPAKLICERNDL